MEEKNVYKRLQEARAKLKNTSLKKSGNNKFAGYMYFELGDFLPTVTEICNNVGIACIPTFTKDVATLTIYNADNKDDYIVINSPMAEIEIKGCNAIQNLGSVETYERRYLYMNAFEVVENDLSEAVTGKDESGEQSSAKSTKKTAKSDTPETVVPPTVEQDFSKMVRDTIKDIAVKNLPIKKDLVEFIKKDVGITLKDIGTTSSENLQKIDEFIKNYTAPVEPAV
jgi:hypothetical protein